MYMRCAMMLYLLTCRPKPHASKQSVLTAAAAAFTRYHQEGDDRLQRPPLMVVAQSGRVPEQKKGGTDRTESSEMEPNRANRAKRKGDESSETERKRVSARALRGTFRKCIRTPSCTSSCASGTRRRTPAAPRLRCSRTLRATVCLK